MDQQYEMQRKTSLGIFPTAANMSMDISKIEVNKSNYSQGRKNSIDNEPGTASSMPKISARAHQGKNKSISIQQNRLSRNADIVKS